MPGQHHVKHSKKHRSIKTLLSMSLGYRGCAGKHKQNASEEAVLVTSDLEASPGSPPIFVTRVAKE